MGGADNGRLRPEVLTSWCTYVYMCYLHNGVLDNLIMSSLCGAIRYQALTPRVLVRVTQF